ncbi:trk system potassium uptake protein TrkA [Ruminococcus sp. YE71]|uniref:potassium channel family protein n=1 Tax=unclassified Ruminococcus TaxID=2608920 RepID=UPI00088E2CF7|nr:MULTISPECIES: TrkA family potassium uptake protein [unclassified Ruminococcus]SDA12532.1 trk system potassium uptake protein TrkA [Ruminococcus sp. YE78]SFW17082.1 trk system potassium uptake protein TrkA [Ruminococcus sp. YE71]
MTSALIVGVGEFGSHIAKRMNELNCEVMAVDISEERIDDILPYVTSARIGDSTDTEFLRTLGVGNFDICIVAVGGLFQVSLETTCNLKELGAKHVTARATNDVQMKFLRMVGADEVAYPEKQTAIRIATKYASETILDFIELDNNYSIYELKVPKEWWNKTLIQVDIRKKYNINILTFKRGDKVFLPNPETVMEEGDIAFVIGEIRDIQKCFKI